MDYRFYKEPDSGLAHCYAAHGVKERDAIEVLRQPGQRLERTDGSLVAEGQTEAGRFLRVIYREELDLEYVFIITAYDLKGKAKQTFRRRRRSP